MMATVPHVISGLGLGKFQADGFLLTRVYTKNGVMTSLPSVVCLFSSTFVYAMNEREACEIYAR